MVNQYEIIALNNGVASQTDSGDVVSLSEGGLSLDTYGDEDISLNYQIDDILDITKRNTSWSKTIRLPGTPKNNRFFQSIYDVNIDLIYFNPAKRIPVVVRVGTNDVLRGFMQIMDITIDNKEINYEVSITGSFKDIISTIEDYNLDILDLSEYNHTRNQATIVNSWDYNIYKWGTLTNVENLGDGYVYPYIINGNSEDIYNTAYIYDMFPAVYLKTIMDKIFEFAGYTYTSEFFNSDYFKKLIIPFTGDKLQITKEEEDARTVNVGVDAAATYVNLTPYQRNGWDWYYNNDDDWYLPLNRESGTVDDNGTPLEFSDEDNQYTQSSYDNHKFTCAETGYYDVNVRLKVVPRYLRDNGNDIGWNDGNFEYRWQLINYKANGSTVILDSSIDPNDPSDIYGVRLFSPNTTDTQPSPWTDLDSAFTIEALAEDVLVETGDIIRMRIGFRHPSAVDWNGTDSRMYAKLMVKQSFDGQFSKFSVTPSNNDSLGNEYINMNQILDSKIKMKEFFLDVVKMFNLIIQDDPNKINNLIVEPRDEFFKSRQRVLNWDEEKKLDNDSTVKITPMSELDAKSYLFTYKKDDDLYNKEYFDETKRIYGDREIRVLNDFSDRVNKLELGFSPTPDAQSWIDSRVAPFFVEQDDESIKPKKVNRRILFYGGPQDLYTGSQLVLKDYPGQAAGSTTTVTKYPYCGMWDHPFNPKYDLGFGRTEKIYWNATVFPNNNLYEQFHKQTMQNIIDVNAKLLECSVLLTPKDMADFDFRDIIFLLGSYWRINKIKDYNPVQTDRVTKVVLYKIIDLNVLQPDQVQVPTSNASCPTDMISKREKTKNGIRWITVSQSGQEVTEDCCSSLGGTFINGTCVLRTIGVIGPVRPIKDEKGIYVNTGGLDVAPTSDKYGPEVFKRFGTTRHNPTVTTIGKGNYVPAGTNGGFILGDNNTIAPNLDGTIVIGDGISANETGTIYLGGIKIGQDGNIMFNGDVIIDGGEDEVFNFNKTNLIDIIDGTEDSVRNPGGDSKARPIIDSNPDNPN